MVAGRPDLRDGAHPSRLRVVTSVLSWLDGFVHSSGAGGLGALLAALIAWSAARAGLRQRATSASDESRRHAEDARHEKWWSRLQWALDRYASSDPRERHIGEAYLFELINSRFADAEEATMIEAIIERSRDHPPVATLSDRVRQWHRRVRWLP